MAGKAKPVISAVAVRVARCTGNVYGMQVEALFASVKMVILVKLATRLVSAALPAREMVNVQLRKGSLRVYADLVLLVKVVKKHVLSSVTAEALAI